MKDLFRAEELILFFILMKTGKEINRITETEAEPAHMFVVNLQSSLSQSSPQDGEETTWPQTLFFEKKNMWLEETEADLKSRGIEVIDICLDM